MRDWGLAAVATLVLSACGGGSIDDETEANEDAGRGGGGECGDLNMAVNPWVGYEASAYVVGIVARRSSAAPSTTRSSRRTSPGRASAPARSTSSSRTGATPTWRRSSSPSQGDGTATDFGPPGNVGIIGWYVPPWLAEEHPDILDWENLNKYAEEFATSESGGKGQFLGADPSYVQFDEAIVSNLDLDFQVVFSGSEAASIEAFQTAEENKEWLIGYFYEPQYFNAEVPLQKVALPPYEEGCQDDPADVACDYPETPLKKIVSHGVVAESDSTAVAWSRTSTWTNEDQNLVADVHRRGRHVAGGRRRRSGSRRTRTRSRPGSTLSRTGRAVTARRTGAGPTRTTG